MIIGQNSGGSIKMTEESKKLFNIINMAIKI